jgi:hypothetical protein
MPRGRGSLELLETEREMCNLLSKYSPEYVRSRVLKTPGDTIMVLVSFLNTHPGQQQVR